MAANKTGNVRPAWDVVQPSVCAASCVAPRGSCVAGFCTCSPGYFGPDCSETACPQNCFGHGECRQGTCVCQEGWLGQACESMMSIEREATVQEACSRPCSPGGRCKDDLCVCLEHFSGEDCSSVDPEFPELKAQLRNWVANLAASSYSAAQERATGEMKFRVNAGTKLVKAQQAQVDRRVASPCPPGFAGPKCDIPSCPYDCNGKGLCVRGSCICHALLFGDACQHRRCPGDCSGAGYCFQGQCRCSTGFGGPDCATLLQEVSAPVPISMTSVAVTSTGSAATLRVLSQKTCPSNCTQHGECQDGKCTCNQGYGGEACQIECPGLCSGRGTCDSSGDTAVCECEIGYSGDDCNTTVCCSGHGSCVTVTNATASIEQCECDVGWTGDECAQELLCADPTCSNGNGVCLDGKCECLTGYSGLTCDMYACGTVQCGDHGTCNPITRRCDCELGFVGPECNLELLACPRDCNLRGLCLNGKCMCGLGWMGDDCSLTFFQPGLTRSELVNRTKGALRGVNTSQESIEEGVDAQMDGLEAICGDAGDCSNHGQCNTTTGQCVCDDGFTGSDCWGRRCPGDCSGHGDCNATTGVCECESGWGSDSCGDRVCSAACIYGRCVNATCECDPGWEGIACEAPVCVGGCGEHGTCGVRPDSNSTECVCDEGWAGPRCDRRAIYLDLDRCLNNCSAVGLCLNGTCLCPPGYGGEDCSTRACEDVRFANWPDCDEMRCPGDCSGHGQCLNGTCACNASFAGPGCSTSERCWETCNDTEFCGNDTSSEQCTDCVEGCEATEAAEAGPAVNWSHELFEDLRNTLLQRASRTWRRDEQQDASFTSAWSPLLVETVREPPPQRQRHRGRDHHEVSHAQLRGRRADRRGAQQEAAPTRLDALAVTDAAGGAPRQQPRHQGRKHHELSQVRVRGPAARPSATHHHAEVHGRWLVRHPEAHHSQRHRTHAEVMPPRRIDSV